MIDADPTPTTPTDNAAPAIVHTPGPWRIDLDDIISGSRCIRVEADGRTGSVAYCQDAHQFPDGLTAAETTANAHLITAAPDLLQALRDLLRETNGGGKPCAGVWINNACEAIAKATGVRP